MPSRSPPRFRACVPGAGQPAERPAGSTESRSDGRPAQLPTSGAVATPAASRPTYRSRSRRVHGGLLMAVALSILRVNAASAASPFPFLPDLVWMTRAGAPAPGDPTVDDHQEAVHGIAQALPAESR